MLLALALVADLAIRFPAPVEKTLDNGLKVIAMEDRSTPVVAVQVWYHAGSKDEARGKRGLAHMFEHMMFRGTEKHGPGEFDRILDEAGASNNAFTTEDVTAYFDDAPAEKLELVLALEADRMRGLKLVEAIVSSEREVVKEEKRLRLDNDPVGKTLETFRGMAFEKHPYSWTPAGLLEELDSITPEDARAFYDRFYQPNNAVLVIVGDVAAARAIELAERAFGAIPRGPKIERAIEAEPPQTKMRDKTLALATQQPMLVGGYHVPSIAHADQAALEVLGAILSGGQSSRLYDAMVRKKKLAVFAGGQTEAMEDSGLFLVFAAFLPDQDPARVRDALLVEIDRLAKDGVTERELTKAKNQLTAGYIFSLATTSAKASELGHRELLEGGWRTFLTATTRFDTVTREQVQNVAKKYLRRENLTIVTLLPEDE